MKFRRLTALITLIAICLATLTSCGKLEKKLAKAEDHFRSSPYKMDVTVDFTAEDEEIAGIFSELERTQTTVYFDGTSFKSVNVMSIDTGDSLYKFSTVYTVIGQTAYRDIAYETDGIPSSPIKSYAFLDDAQRLTLAYKVSRVGGVTTGGFANLTDTKIDKKTVSVLCTEASDEVKESLRKMMVSFFEGSLERAVAKSVTLTLVLFDGHYKSAVVSCDYDVTIGGKVYSVSAAVNLAFDFGNDYKVYTPADASEYSVIDPEDMMPL